MEKLESLLRRTLEGDRDAFGEVIGRFQDMAFGCAYAILGDFHLAEDAAQEAFLQAYRSLAGLKDLARFPRWLRRIVVGACDRIIRSRRPAAIAESERAIDTDDEPARAAERAEAGDRALEALAALSDPLRVATTLFYIDGYKVDEIAGFLAVPSGTVKYRLHESRKQLRERMVSMLGDSLRKHAPTPEFRQEIMKRIAHWERFKGTDQEKTEMVESDPEWAGLTEIEIALEPMSDECRKIRKRIASMESCHEHYLENVKAVLEMIGTMTPGRILDCGQACKARKKEAAAYADALRTWRTGGALPEGADPATGEAFGLLGQPAPDKLQLVDHLIGKLVDNDYRVYADEDENFDLTESRIQHLDVCNYNWERNLRIVLQEIAAGKRLFDWHVPEGFNAHGDCPNRVSELRDIVAEAAGWAEGKMGKAGEWKSVLGERTPEKRWLVASLCKHVSAQHAAFDGERLLAKPAL